MHNNLVAILTALKTAGVEVMSKDGGDGAGDGVRFTPERKEQRKGLHQPAAQEALTVSNK